MADQELSGTASSGAKGEAAKPEGSRTPGAGAAGERGAHKLGPPPLSTGPISPTTICVCGFTLGAHLAPHPHEIGVLSCLGFRAAPLPIGTPIPPEGPLLSCIHCGNPVVLTMPRFGLCEPCILGALAEEPLSGTGSHPQDLGPINAAAGAIRSHPGLQGLSDQEIDDLHAHLCAITGVIPAEERARQSAPAMTASHNSGEGEPSVKPAYTGADTGVSPCDPSDPRPIWEQGLADSFTTSGGIDNLPIESAKSDLWLVYSNEHRAWWGPGHHGYTTDTDRAGRYSHAAAAAICAQANIVPRDPPNEVMVLAPERGSIWSVGDLSDAELAALGDGSR